MSDDNIYHTLQSDDATRVEALRDTFERAWRAGALPRIEEFLRQIDVSLRPAAFLTLLKAEIKLRRGRSEPIAADDYLSRFAEYEDAIRATCDAADDSQRTLHFQPSAPVSGLHVRCPHCHNPIELVPDAELESIQCRSCGSEFSLTTDDSAAGAARGRVEIGHFKLVERLGMGAFGAVWKGHDTELDRTVAIKIPRSGQLDRLHQELFLREARSAAQLRHPNIVPVYEVGRDGDTLYIVSEYIRGIDLADWLEGQQLTAREVASLSAIIGDALEHAHDHGVIHRDLKPANIMMADDGQPHIMDFGLARRDMGEITMTVEGQLLGTPAYMSPEQAQGEAHKADRRSDVYSMGVILFQMLTGELPFRGNSRMLLQQVIHDEPPSPRKLNSSVPKDMETITLRCLEKDPKRRFPSAAGLAAELRRFLAGEPIESRPLSAPERAWRWCRRKPLVAGLSATIASLVALVAIAGPLAAIQQAALRRTAEAHEQQALEAKSAAENATREAERRFLKARETVDIWLTGYSEALQNIPVHGVQAVRTRMLELAAQEYEAFAGEKTQDATLQLEQGRTLIRLGSIYRVLGRADEALAKFAAAQAVLKGLLDDDRVSREARPALALALGTIALVHADGGNVKQADAEFNSAIEQLETGLQQSPTAAEFLLPLVTLWTNRGGVLAKAGDYQPAEAAFVKALIAGETLVEANPDDVANSAALAAARIGAGQVQLVQGDAAAASGNLEKAAAFLAAANEQRRDAPQYLELAVTANLNLAAARRRLGDAGGERQANALAIEAVKRLSASHPEIPAYRMEKAMTQIDLGQSMIEQYEPKSAEPLLHEAVAGLASLSGEYPAVAGYHETLGVALDNLAQALVAIGRHSDALACADQAVREFQGLATTWPDVAAYKERLAIAESTAAQILHSSGKKDDALERFAASDKVLEELNAASDLTAERHQIAALLLSRYGEAMHESDPAGAAKLFQRAARLWEAALAASADPQFASGAAWFYATCPSEAQRQPERACELAAKALASARDNPRYRLALAMAQGMAGLADKCRATAQIDAVKNYAAAPAFDFALALAAHSDGRPVDARAAWDKAAGWVTAQLPGHWEMASLRRVTAARLGIEPTGAQAAVSATGK